MATIDPQKVIADGEVLTAAKAGLVSCHDCRMLSRPRPGVKKQACPRCSATLHGRKPNSISRTWALVIAAAIFYIPANVLPVTHTTYLGSAQSDTILSGIIYFMTSGSWHIALIIFVASIVVPALKILVLSYLLISIHRRSIRHPQERTRLYRMLIAVGRWSMVDVFVITVSVALLRLGLIASIDAGVGIVFFACVVVLTMFASETFDPRLIWDAMEEQV
jgi:paraquat-inducible protein A